MLLRQAAQLRSLLHHCSSYSLMAVQVLGVKEYHRNCTENLHEGFTELGLVPPEVSAVLRTC